MSVESVITENLDIWTSAIKTKSASGRGSSNKLELYGIKKLRELIFELAIRGKLVSPEVTDIPVNDLLRTIEEEKAQLVKSKEIKKPKKLPAIQNDEVPFDVPEGWQWVRLGVLGNIFNGNSVNAKLKEEKYTGLAQGLPFIATKDVGYGFEQLDYDNGVLIPSGEPKFKVAKAGAVLVCAEGGSAGKKCGITNKDICFGNKLFANQLYGNISPRYILSCYLSPTFYKMFSESMTGIIGGISAAKFSELMIPLPPLSYQNRLVSKIDELMLLCDQLESETESSIDAHKTLVETLLAMLTNAKDADELNESWQRISEHFDTLFTTEDSIDQLKQSILQLAVMGKLVKQDPNDEPASALLERIAEEKEQLIKDKKIKKPKATEAILDEEVEFELPSKWSLVKCQDVCLKITDGEHSTPRRTETGHYLLSARNVTNEGIKLSDVDYVPTSEFERIRKRCDPNIGDILISCSGSVGRVAIVDADNKYSMVRSAAMIRPEPSLSVEYLALLLRSPYLQRQIKKRSKQSAQANLFLGAISSLTFAIPPKNEQIKIAEKVDELLAICNLLKFQISEAQATQINLSDSISSSLVN
ncbi:type I restriction endonuclease subunit S [Pseudoalteromonas sp. S4492]|uniref:restriction endonuclease subunit S n=1 Tax=Pseudoalteromonas sp. S4492 TaxID=579560 RepID=UPI00110B0083|nr:restriction endonuclease subunit S [Pseudoalteromonas sp. S4492]TMO30745.1 type I restriction endonuclease subunit S [Pseudoalteromonas sp. S4492]